MGKEKEKREKEERGCPWPFGERRREVRERRSKEAKVRTREKEREEEGGRHRSFHMETCLNTTLSIIYGSVCEFPRDWDSLKYYTNISLPLPALS